MTPFTRVQRDPISCMMYRNALLEQPCDFFKGFFEGRTPSLEEKMLFVEQAIQRLSAQHIFQNDTYLVQIVYQMPFIHLDITRHDAGPCNNWRDFQRIKNELIGPEHEAVELFPAESRLVDTANEYHLWVHADPKFRFPLGFTNRFVLDQPLRANIAFADHSDRSEPVRATDNIASRPVLAGAA